MAAGLAGVGLGLALAAGGLVGVGLAGFVVVVAVVRGRAFVVVDEFVFWAKAIVENAKSNAKLNESFFMLCSS